MIKEMDELLHHWADQHRGRGLRQCSPLGRLVEFGGMPPRSNAPQASRDPLGLGDMDEAAWQVEQALRALDDEHQVLAHEHYRWGGYNDDKARRLGIARRTYYDRLDRLHAALLEQLQATHGQRARA
jgi:DNA-directed RNA polymerase specialized sigma24 family protein